MEPKRVEAPGSQGLSASPADQWLRLAGLEMRVQTLARAVRVLAEVVDDPAARHQGSTADDMDKLLCDCGM